MIAVDGNKTWVGTKGTVIGHHPEKVRLGLARAVMGELVLQDRAGVGYKSTNYILLQPYCQIQIRPCLIAILQHWHAEHELMNILEITVTAPLRR